VHLIDSPFISFEYSMNQNLYALIQSRFPADTSKPLLILPAGRTISYAEADQGAAHFAAVLTDAGVTPGDRVMVQTDKSPEAVMLYLACLRLGSIYIPLNTAYTPTEVDYFLNDAEPTVLVCRSKSLDALSAIAAKAGVAKTFVMDGDGSGSLADAASTAKPLEAIADCSNDDLAAILYTSGTTGRSKGAMLSHENLSSNALTLHEIWAFEDGDVLLHALPIYHVHGLFVALHCALMNGSSIHFLDKFDPDTVIGLLPKSTVMMGVPTFYTRLLTEDGFTSEVSKNIRLFVSGSAPMLAETHVQFTERTGHKILERYGMTEGGMITSNPYDGDRVPGTVGPALHDVQVRICDKDGTPVAAGEIGVLEYKGPNLFKGYWRMPEKTAEEFRSDGFFVSGDNAIMDKEGRVSIVGRDKDLIITGGYNVYPKEIEIEIDQMDGVIESAVIGLPHKDFGEGVTAVVVAKEDGSITEDAIIDALKDKLARFKQPKRVYFVSELPRNAMGKVQKNSLRETYSGTYDS
jgi:malonyl-CoA/methylmalonyl-CoA synthetase